MLNNKYSTKDYNLGCLFSIIVTIVLIIIGYLVK